MQLGEFGVWMSRRVAEAENAGEAARLAEDLGFGSFWLGGSPQLASLRPLLEATERIVVATGILNLWQSEPGRVADDFTTLNSEFQGRVLLGIGVGHPEMTSTYAKPLAAMGAFLDGLDTAATVPIPREARCLAALSPKMLELSAKRSLGAHTYFVPTEHTRAAREHLGDGPLLAPELACVLDNGEPGRATARAYAQTYLRLRNYTQNLLNSGFRTEDIADGGSDRLIDAIIPQGTADQLAAAARQHLAAGANHVCLQVVGVKGIPGTQWTALASALGISN